MKAVQSPAQLHADVAESEAGSALTGYYGIIRRAEQAFMVPVKFPDQPLESISLYCVADLATHGYSYSYGGNGGFCPEYDEIGCVNFVPLPGNPQEILSFQKPLMPGKAGTRTLPI